MFSCEFYEIFKKNFFYRAPLVAASYKRIIVIENSIWYHEPLPSPSSNEGSFSKNSYFYYYNDHKDKIWTSEK